MKTISIRLEDSICEELGEMLREKMEAFARQEASRKAADFLKLIYNEKD